jgi:hypothetical protein
LAATSDAGAEVSSAGIALSVAAAEAPASDGVSVFLQPASASAAQDTARKTECFMERSWMVEGKPVLNDWQKIAFPADLLPIRAFSLPSAGDGLLR